MKNSILNLYIGVPRLTKMLLPIVFLGHLLTAFCLNSSAYFKKVDGFNYELIGHLISVYYLGCLLGALVGGTLTLRFNTTKISGLGMMLLGVLFYHLNAAQQSLDINLLMFFFGLIGTMVTTNNVAGYVAEYYGPNTVFKCCALLGCFCFIFSLILKKIRQTTQFNEIITET